MKNFKVTVNGYSYDVQVEEVGSVATPVGQAAPAPAVAPTPTPAPVQAVAPAQTAAPAAAPAAGGKEGNIKVTAPMPGTVLDIKVSVGQKVSENQVAIILEAMKMENEIVVPGAGTVSSINVSKGDSVNSGDVMVTVQG